MNITDTITYRETASLLGISYHTLTNAIARGVLTPLPRGGGRAKGKLARKQVELFLSPDQSSEKKFLSLSALTPEEREIWGRVKCEIEGIERPSQPQPGEIPQIDTILEAIEKIAMFATEVIEELLTANIQDPRELIEAISNSSSFKKIMDMLGVKPSLYKEMSDEDKKKLTMTADKVAAMVMFKVANIKAQKLQEEQELLMQMLRERQTA